MVQIKDREIDTHPSYGVVGFYRTQGDPGKMFGSALPQHGHFVSLKIRRAVREFDGPSEWVFGKKELVEVWLSAAQFADLLTTMNVGSGVPCTLRYAEGEPMPMPPDTSQTEAEQINTGFAHRMAEFASELRGRVADARKVLLAKGTLTVGKRKEVFETLEWLDREVRNNIPFVLSRFQEAVEKTVSHAKAEVDAMVTTSVQQAGLKALQAPSLGPGLPPSVTLTGEAERPGGNCPGYRTRFDHMAACLECGYRQPCKGIKMN